VATNVKPPKFASGSTVHRPVSVHADGASATHSADATSGVGDAMVSRFWNVFFFCVTFVMRIVTFVVETATLAAIPSPAFIGSLIVTGAAGKSLYQTEYVTRPVAEQLAWVPTCSSACEVVLNPPRPTQNAEYVGVPTVHVAVGCRHAPDTLRDLAAHVRTDRAHVGNAPPCCRPCSRGRRSRSSSWWWLAVSLAPFDRCDVTSASPAPSSARSHLQERGCLVCTPSGHSRFQPRFGAPPDDGPRRIAIRVEVLGGTISVQSPLGAGTAVEVELPLDD
jgi:hypothetical protein